jgi:flagellar basal body-associated protein FliL
VTWPNAAIILGIIVLVIILVGGAFSTFLDLRKATLVAAQEDSLRQLVSRYEQLAENTQDAQQRVATDLAELRTRTAAIEQILRTVE